MIKDPSFTEQLRYCFLFVLSFVMVYREVFETVLFYAALWNENNGVYLLAGLLTGIVILTIIAAVMLRTTRRLPIAKFFAASSALVAVLSVVLTGKEIAPLQEAGMLNVTPVSGPESACWVFARHSGQ
jgi:high-affinity iron transporter